MPHAPGTGGERGEPARVGAPTHRRRRAPAATPGLPAAVGRRQRLDGGLPADRRRGVGADVRHHPVLPVGRADRHRGAGAPGGVRALRRCRVRRGRPPQAARRVLLPHLGQHRRPAPARAARAGAAGHAARSGRGAVRRFRVLVAGPGRGRAAAAAPRARPRRQHAVVHVVRHRSRHRSVGRRRRARRRELRARRTASTPSCSRPGSTRRTGSRPSRRWERSRRPGCGRWWKGSRSSPATPCF